MYGNLLFFIILVYFEIILFVCEDDKQLSVEITKQNITILEVQGAPRPSF